MVVSKQQAAEALQDIDSAQQRTQAMLRYRASAPYFLIWGCVLLLANCITEFSPASAGRAWLALDLTGALLSIALAIHQARQRGAGRSWQLGAVWLVILGYFIASFALLPPLDARQGNAYISLFWSFMYCVMGIFTGRRILIVGIVTAASILLGYFWIIDHYFLWMGLVTASLLILGGAWLRKV